MTANLTRCAILVALWIASGEACFGQYTFAQRSRSGAAQAAWQNDEPPPLPAEAAQQGAQPMPGPQAGAQPMANGGYFGPSQGAMGCCDQCGDPSCGGGCCPPGFRFHTFGGVEYLSMWNFGNKTPALVSTSPQGTSQFLNGNHNLPNAGVLGRAGIPVYGGAAGDLNTTQKNGGRLTVGMFLDCDYTVAWVNRFVAIDGGDQNFAQTSVNGNPTITRPYFDVFSIVPPGENTFIVGYRNENGLLLGDGDIAINSSSEYLFAESYLKTMMHEDGQLRVDLVSGYQYTKISTDLTVDSSTTFFPNGPFRVDLHDHFRATNDFHGGVFGFQIEQRSGRFSLNTLIKAGFGATRQAVRIDGFGTQTVGGNTAALNGSFLVQNSNAGPNLDTTYTRWVGSVVPELNMTLGMWVTPHLQITCGYTGIYWTDVMQAGSAVDRRINLSQQTGNLVGQAVPAFTWRDGSYWMQGFNAGLNWDF